MCKFKLNINITYILKDIFFKYSNAAIYRYTIIKYSLFHTKPGQIIHRNVIIELPRDTLGKSQEL